MSWLDRIIREQAEFYHRVYGIDAEQRALIFGAADEYTEQMEVEDAKNEEDKS